MPGWLTNAFCWLNENSGAVMAVVTAVGTFLTLLLWTTTKRQANVTREIFEATHRPHLSIRPHLKFSANPGFVRMDLQLRNHGSVPAQVDHWAANLAQGGVTLAEAAALSGGLCVFPGAGEDAPHLKVEGQAAASVWNNNPPVYLHAKASYRGNHAARYSIALRARLRITGQQDFALDEVEHDV